MTKNEIKNIVRSAFNGVKLGNGIGLREADAIDDYASKEVREQKRQEDEKNDWSKITVDDLNQFHCSLAFFDADGMRFHMPAFMVAEIDSHLELPSSLFYLTDLSDYRKAQFQSLTQAQRAAVRQFLLWCIDQAEYEYERPEIETSLNEYWTETR